MTHKLKTNKQYLVIEGPDGVGKTTLINKIKEYCLIEYHEPILFVTQPTKTHLGNFCREISQIQNIDKKILCELFFLDRLQQQIELKNTMKTHHVICDRSFHSSFVYQDFDHSIKMMEKYDILIPHKTLFLMDEPEKIKERKKLRNTNDILDLLDTQELLNKYHNLFNYLSKEKFHKIEMVDMSTGIEKISRNVLDSISRSKNQ